MKWMTIRALAQARGLSATAVRAALDAMESRGAKVRTRKAGGVLQVDLPDFDLKRAAAMSPRRLQGEATKRAARGSSAEPSDPVFLKEQARKIAAEASLRELEVRRQKGELRDLDKVREAATDYAVELAAKIDQIPVMYAELATQASRIGVASVRNALREIARSLKDASAEGLARVAATGGAGDGE
jgi:hypothetical protein